MKTRTKLFIAVAIVMALIAGFFIGTVVHFPSADNSGLSGTIAKVNNYRNVKISESDIKLRSELLDNEELCQQLQRYFTFHYAVNVQLATNIDNALKTTEVVQEFTEKFGKEMKSLSGFNTYLNEVRKDYLLLLATLQRIKETDQQSIGLLINNAYNAVIQTGSRNQTVVDFTDAITDFFKTEAMVNYPELQKAHDALLINLIRNSAVTGDKMMIRFLDKKEFLGSKENIQSQSFCDKTFLNNVAVSDMAGLENMISLSDKQNLSNIFSFSDKQALEGRAISDKQALEGRAISDKQALGSQVMADKENMQARPLFSAEALNLLFLNDAGQFLSSRKEDLGTRFIFDAQTLESSSFFSDKENLSLRLGRAETLESFLNAENLNLRLQ